MKTKGINLNSENSKVIRLVFNWTCWQLCDIIWQRSTHPGSHRQYCYEYKVVHIGNIGKVFWFRLQNISVVFKMLLQNAKRLISKNIEIILYIYDCWQPSIMISWKCMIIKFIEGVYKPYLNTHIGSGGLKQQGQAGKNNFVIKQ